MTEWQDTQPLDFLPHTPTTHTLELSLTARGVSKVWATSPGPWVVNWCVSTKNDTTTQRSRTMNGKGSRGPPWPWFNRNSICFLSHCLVCFASVLSWSFYFALISHRQQCTPSRHLTRMTTLSFILYSCPAVVCDSCREEYCCGPICEKCDSDREHLMKCDKCEAPVCDKCIVITKGLREGNTCKSCKTGAVSPVAQSSAIPTK